MILPFLKEGCPIFLINTIKYSGRTAENTRLGLGKQHRKETDTKEVNETD